MQRIFETYNMGRKAKTQETKKKARTIYATNPEWSEIKEKAGEQEVSPYIIEKILK